MLDSILFISRHHHPTTLDSLINDPFFASVPVPQGRIKLDSHCKGMINKAMKANELRRYVGPLCQLDRAGTWALVRQTLVWLCYVMLCC